MTRTSQFDFGSGPDPDPGHQWDTKRKLVSLAEVCAPLSGVLVSTCIGGVCLHIVSNNEPCFVRRYIINRSFVIIDKHH